MSDKELLSRNLQPILLGDSKSTRRLARSIYKKYGVISYICDSKRTTSSLFSQSFAFWKVSGADFPELLCEELIRLASFDEECIYIVIPTDECYRAITEKHLDKLCAFFLLNTPEDPFRDIPLIKPERR